MFQVIYAALVDVLQWVINALHVISVGVVGAVFSAFGSLVPSVSGQLAAYQTVYNNIDFFFPLSEVITMALAYFALWVGVLVYRTVKSWIPTVSS